MGPIYRLIWKAVKIMVPFGVIQVVVIWAGWGSNCITVTCEGARGTDSEGSCRLKLPTYEGSRRYRPKCKHESKLKVNKQRVLGLTL